MVLLAESLEDALCDRDLLWDADSLGVGLCDADSEAVSLLESL